MDNDLQHLISTDKSQADQMLPNFLELAEIQSRLQRIDGYINEFMASNQGKPEILYEAAYHLIKAGGKRLRSLIAVLACEAVGGEIEDVLPVALAAELLQTASLIHDDLIDDDETRRGVPTVHSIFGRKTALLAGDLLISQAIRLLGDYGEPDLLSHIGVGGTKMCEGEAADLYLSPERPEDYTLEEYLEITQRKTVSFIEAAVAIGVRIGGGDEVKTKALKDYAKGMGVAFQIRDDILDVQSHEHTVGKTTKSDLRLGRPNYVILSALRYSDEETGQKLFKALVDEDIHKVLQIVDETAVVALAKEDAKQHITKAKRALREVKILKKHLLNRMADYVIHRNV
ncbi:MAG: hypothetical protein GF309_00740 [Candidatus Lokiarchaeota archaeon]|nr:hypothetical protein [Candidatus Lokiarchaeota archaeon]